MIRGVTVVLGEMDVARPKPKPWPGGKPPVRKATGMHPSSQRRPPTSGGLYKIGHLPSGQRPPGPDYVGHWGMGMACGEDKERDRLTGKEADLESPPEVGGRR